MCVQVTHNSLGTFLLSTVLHIVLIVSQMWFSSGFPKDIIDDKQGHGWDEFQYHSLHLWAQNIATGKMPVGSWHWEASCVLNTAGKKGKGGKPKDAASPEVIEPDKEGSSIHCSHWPCQNPSLGDSPSPLSAPTAGRHSEDSLIQLVPVVLNSRV